jgi:hypothetical protein
MRYLFVLIAFLAVTTVQASPPKRTVYVPVYVPRPVPVYVPTHIPRNYGYGFGSYYGFNYGSYLQRQYFLRQQAIERQMFQSQLKSFR